MSQNTSGCLKPSNTDSLIIRNIFTSQVIKYDEPNTGSERSNQLLYFSNSSNNCMKKNFKQAINCPHNKHKRVSDLVLHFNEVGGLVRDRFEKDQSKQQRYPDFQTLDLKLPLMEVDRVSSSSGYYFAQKTENNCFHRISSTPMSNQLNVMCPCQTAPFTVLYYLISFI